MENALPGQHDFPEQTKVKSANHANERECGRREGRHVAAGVSPAVEPGILPGGTSPRIPKASGYLQIAEQPGVLSGRQDAALNGSQDGRRYAKHICRYVAVPL